MTTKLFVPWLVLMTILAAAPPLHALPGGVLVAAGERSGFNFEGTVSATGAGHFVLTGNSGGSGDFVCVYTSFTNVQISAPVASFDSVGSCVLLATGAPFTSSSHFGLIDYATPGTGIDNIDVNAIGATGISVSGGPISRGEILVTT